MSVFSNVKWTVIGDSISINLSQTQGNYPHVIKTKVGDASFSVTNTAANGFGYFARQTSALAVFIEQADRISGNPDVVSIFGSTNDNGLVNNPKTDLGSTIPSRAFASTQTGESVTNHGWWLNSITNPANDAKQGTGDAITYGTPQEGHEDDPKYNIITTYAGLVNKTWWLAHAKAPNAKILVVPPIYRTNTAYPLHVRETCPGTYDVALTIIACYEDWRRKNILGCQNWLYMLNMWVDYTVSESGGNVTVSAKKESGKRVYIDDRSTLDDGTVVPEFKDQPLTFRRISDKEIPGWDDDSETGGPYIFGKTYCEDVNETSTRTQYQDWLVGGFVHPRKVYAEQYLAKKFAYKLCEMLGKSTDELPEGLKYYTGSTPTGTVAYSYTGEEMDTAYLYGGSSVDQLYNHEGGPLI